jgi:DNA-binding NtrC family response regulator
MSSSIACPPAAVRNPARKCILVVEDELLIRFMLSDGLRDSGFHVIEACNADEALAILETARPDIIVTDVRMPGSIDGLGLLAKVRATFPALPVIITSGHLVSSEALSEGATSFVPKPYHLEAIVEMVQEAIGNAK